MLCGEIKPSSETDVKREANDEDRRRPRSVSPRDSATRPFGAWIYWRGGWDSNPRGLSDPTRFRDEHVQPLRHLPSPPIQPKGGLTPSGATALPLLGDPGATRTPDLFLRREAL